MEWMILPIQRYADFQGRSRRMEYWMFTLFQILIALVFVVIFAIFVGFSGNFESSVENNPMVMIFILIFALIYLGLFFIPAIAVGIRRWHDQDKSGWFFLLFVVLGAIPVVGFLASIANIVFMCLPGTNGPNRFGEDPFSAEHLGDVFK